MKYRDYSVEDFVKDEEFIKWLKTNDPELKEFWETWIKTYPEKNDIFSEAKEIVLNLDFSKEVIPFEAKKEMWKNIHSQLSKEKPNQYRTIKRRQWLAVAATIILLVSIGMWNFFRPKVQKYTTHAEQKEFVLNDGTKVILSPNSSLTINPENQREVQLIGDAFFDVAKQPLTKESFIVRTDDLVVRVLGTVFKIVGSGEATKVLLVEGKVLVELEDKEYQTINMDAGDIVTYSKELMKVPELKKMVAIDRNSSWKSGVLTIDDKPLSQVLEALSEIYSVKFQLDDQELKNRLINGGVPLENIRIAIETLAGIYNFHIEREGDTYILIP